MVKCILLSLLIQPLGDEFESEVNLSELKTKEITVDPDEKGEFSFSLPRTKKDIKFKLLTAGDEDAILKAVEKRTQDNQISNPTYLNL